jgi:hypothetical protein
MSEVAPVEIYAPEYLRWALSAIKSSAQFLKTSARVYFDTVKI